MKVGFFNLIGLHTQTDSHLSLSLDETNIFFLLNGPPNSQSTVNSQPSISFPLSKLIFQPFLILFKFQPITFHQTYPNHNNFNFTKTSTRTFKTFNNQHSITTHLPFLPIPQAHSPTHTQSHLPLPTCIPNNPPSISFHPFPKNQNVIIFQVHNRSTRPSRPKTQKPKTPWTSKRLQQCQTRRGGTNQIPPSQSSHH